MAVKTAKIEWRASTTGKTPKRMLELLRDFIVTESGWTLVTDQIGQGAHAAYFVVTKDRATGFAGDNPIIKVEFMNGGVNNPGMGMSNYARYPSIFIECYSAWSGTTGTNLANGQWTYPGQYGYDNRMYWYGPNQLLAFSELYDTDFYLSVDTTGKFILGTSKVIDYSNYQYSQGAILSPIQGVACFERLAGDTSAGTFFGSVNSYMFAGYSNRGYFHVPVRWDGMVSSDRDCHFQLGTRIGVGYQALSNVNEVGKHVMLDIELHRQDKNKIKGKLFGLAITTQTIHFQHHTIFPTIAAPEWIIAKHPTGNDTHAISAMYNSAQNLAMACGSTITTLS